MSQKEISNLEKVISESWDESISGKRGNRKKLYFYGPIFMIMLYTGMRLGEILGLKKCNVDKENKIIHVVEQCTREYERTKDGKKIRKKMVIKSPKTESSIRDLEITEDVIYWIEVLEKRQKEFNIQSEFVAVNKKGNIPTDANVCDTLSRILDDANVNRITSHRLMIITQKKS